MRSRKKGQAEIIGLVVIVIMLSLGLLFLAQFAIKDAGEKKVFTRKGLAYSSVSSIMKTTVLCEKPSGSLEAVSLEKDLLEDCARNYCRDGSFNCDSKFRCSSTGIEMHSCEFLTNEISFMLENTLGAWNKDYIFESKLAGANNVETLLSFGSGSCFGDRDSSGIFPLNVEGSGIVETTLFLCN